MLFKKREYRYCANCARAAALDDGQMLCQKKGLVPEDGCCLSFRYDPLKRIPAHQKPPVFRQYENTDFSL